MTAQPTTARRPVRRRRAAVALAATAALSLVGASQALGATSVTSNGGGLVILGDTNENHGIVVRPDPASSTNYLVRDVVTIFPGTGCTAVDATTVTCAYQPFIGVLVGNGNDSIRLTTRATGVASADRAEVFGGPGNDSFEANGLEADRFVGGEGVDTMSYATRTAPLQLSADGVADDGEAGEGDEIGSDVETIYGGSGPDVMRAADSPRSTLIGSSGDDTLIGSRFDDILLGDDGADTIDGGVGADQVFGGDGDDRLLANDAPATPGGTPAADLYDGGDGVDTVTYDGRATGVTVRIDGLLNDGADGEQDNVATDVENVVGTAQADLLVGSARGNALTGGAGDDRLIGGNGGDELSGGAGRDDIQARDGEPDAVSCGPDADTVDADPVDTLSECEAPAPAGPGAPGAPGASPAPAVRLTTATARLSRAGVAKVKVSCPATAAVRCTGTLALQRRSRGAFRGIGAKRFSVAPGRTAAVSVKVTPAVRSLVARTRGVAVRSVATTRVGAQTTRATRSLRLLPPR
ncbi:MAG: calcium-binding protein [Thermoleophilia bacterium]